MQEQMLIATKKVLAESSSSHWLGFDQFILMARESTCGFMVLI